MSGVPDTGERDWGSRMQVWGQLQQHSNSPVLETIREKKGAG